MCAITVNIGMPRLVDTRYAYSVIGWVYVNMMGWILTPILAPTHHCGVVQRP